MGFVNGSAHRAGAPPTGNRVIRPNRNRSGHKHGFMTGGRGTDNRSATLLMNLSCGMD
jgi:hypothetical protein